MTGPEAIDCETINPSTSSQIANIKNQIRTSDGNAAFGNIATINNESKTCEQLVINLEAELKEAQKRAASRSEGSAAPTTSQDDGLRDPGY